MGNYLTYLLGNNEVDEELSLEKACKLLETEKPEEIPEKLSNYSILDNLVSTRTGEITRVLKDSYIIDHLYGFIKTDGEFALGCSVSYNLFMSNNTLKVTNVELINEWDSIENSNGLWNNRVIICQVENRIGRILYLSSTDIALNLDEVNLEFLPMVGDWLELDVKCILDENSLNLIGKIIEINRISPVRVHLVKGKITCWNENEKVGTVNNKIFFNKVALSVGYIPTLGDKVITEIIESNQNTCSWRALKLLPEDTSKKYDKLSKPVVNLSNYEDSYPGIEICTTNLIFEKLGETKTFSIDIINTSEKEVILTKAEFLDATAQCKILSGNENIEIMLNKTHKINCECTSKNIGQSKEFFSLKLGNTAICKYINIIVSINLASQHIPYEYKPKLKLLKESKNELINGEKLNRIRFLAVHIPTYLVPQKLLSIVSKYEFNEVALLIDELKIMKPSFLSNLTYMNYEDKFHTLLHLDEIANLIAIRIYDQYRVCFIKNGEFLMLEIDNLSERRPSLVIGDRIIATEPLNQKGLDFEGFIHKVGARHVFIKFNQLFHDSYNGEDYSIKVIPSRTSYRRLHHAVHLAVRNLGQKILFPTAISEKEQQVNFTLEERPPISPTNQVKKLLTKIYEHKNKLDSSLKADNSEVKLEWYNKMLNSYQRHAVKHILWGRARPLPYIIFGPPGTGKTVTVIESILQIVRLIPSSRLLVTAPSNSAADLLAIRLIDSGVLKPGDLVRVVSYNYTLSEMVPVKLIPYCVTVSSSKEGTNNADISLNGIKLGCNQSAIGRHRITVATCSTAGQIFSMGFSKGHFTHIIVDEAAQTAEPEVMIPLALLDSNSGQVILAGDPMQLGPVIICKIASQFGLSESYLDRLMNRFPYVRDMESFANTCEYDPRLVTKLLYNYRALPDILNFYNKLFYSDELIPTIDHQTSQEAKLLNTLQEILPIKTDGNIAQIVLHGVDGVNYQTEDSPSWFNPHEAAQVFYYVNEFYRLNVKSSSIGIISPYIKQVKEIRSLLVEAEFDVPRIGTVEEFQGQEFDIIILSTVRSCQEYVKSDLTHSIGFIANPKRLNVAISRAKSLIIIIGNPRLLIQDIYWRSVIEYCMEKGCYLGIDF